MKNPFKLPSPKELGISQSNALPLRDFTPWEKGTTWEDYDLLLKEKYPIRFFLFKTLYKFIKYNIYFSIKNPISDGWYWIKSHTYKRHHLLDLRQPPIQGEIKNIDYYRYGWCDVPEKMLYAMFNLLKEYFNEEPYDLTTTYSRDEIEADPALKSQQFHFDEAKALLHWWEVERKADINNIDKLLESWSRVRSDDIIPNDPVTQIYWKALLKAEEDFEKKTDEMIARLMFIRRGLWT